MYVQTVISKFSTKDTIGYSSVLPQNVIRECSQNLTQFVLKEYVT